MNPIAIILSVAMLLRHSLNLETEAKDIEKSVQKVLNKGYRTGDIYNGIGTIVGTEEMGNLIVKEIHLNNYRNSEYSKCTEKNVDKIKSSAIINKKK